MPAALAVIAEKCTTWGAHAQASAQVDALPQRSRRKSRAEAAADGGQQQAPVDRQAEEDFMEDGNRQCGERRGVASVSHFVLASYECNVHETTRESDAS